SYSHANYPRRPGIASRCRNTSLRIFQTHQLPLTDRCLLPNKVRGRPRTRDISSVMHSLGSPPRLHVLMVDPDTPVAVRLCHALLAVEHDARLASVSGLESSVTALRPPDVSCVVTELDLPDRRGLDVLRMLRAARPEVPVVVCTRAGSEDVAVTAMK